MVNQLTRNFTLQEFASHDGADFPPGVIKNLQILAENLQILRDYLGFPVQINSGYRSDFQNKKVGGAPNSKHKLGMAADIVCQKYTPEQVHAAIMDLIHLKKIVDGGVGQYNGFIHYDISTSRRWDLRTKA